MGIQKSKPARKRSSGPFAANLSAVLKERGVSIRGAAEIAGIAPSVLHDWLAGASCNRPEALVKLCRALKCDFQWLLTGTRPELSAKDQSLAELFEIEPSPDFSGLFMIEAKRLRRREPK